MKSPLFVFAIVYFTAFFGLSWAILTGNWLGFSAFSAEQYLVGETFFSLAYVGAGLSVIFVFAFIAAKMHYR